MEDLEMAGAKMNRIVPKYGYVEQAILNNDIPHLKTRYIKKDGQWVTVTVREANIDKEYKRFVCECDEHIKIFNNKDTK